MPTGFYEASDEFLGTTYPIQSLSARMGLLNLESAVSMFDCGGRQQGTPHGGPWNNSAASNIVLDLRAQLSNPNTARVTTFTVCCSGTSASATDGVQSVTLALANGTRLTLGGTSCSAPQLPIAVPAGYTFAGLITRRSNRLVNWVEQVAFVALRK